MQRSVVQLQLGQRLAQRLVLVGLDRKQSGEHLRLHFLETGKRRGGGLARVRDGVADMRVAQLLDAGDDETDFARRQLVAAARLRREHADLLDQMGRAGGHHQDLVLRPDQAIDDANQNHDADIVVEPGIDDQRLQRRSRIAFRRRHALDDALEDLFEPHACLGAGQHGIVRVEPDHILDFGARFLGIRGGKIHLVKDRQNFHSELDRGVAVGHGLRLDALRGIDHQQRSFAGR